MYTCIFCGEVGYPSACPKCVGERFDPIENEPDDDDYDTDRDQDRCRNCGGAHHIQRCKEILDALFAPAPRILVPTIHTTAREWLDEDKRQDTIARAWSRRLLAKKGAA